jgi:hypothetical protein
MRLSMEFADDVGGPSHNLRMGSVAAYTTNGGKRYRVRYRTPDRRQTDKRGFRTKHDAEQFLASVEVSMGRGE